MTPEITHDSAARRFETSVEDVRCVLDYQLAGSHMTITHTSVPASVGGRGIASALTRTAMDAARDNGWKVTPACTYAAAWLKRHPHYSDLSAG